MVDRHERSPGPAAYTLPPTVGYIDHDKSRWRNPAHQMGLKLHSHYITHGPGPAYLTRDMTRFGAPNPPRFAFNSRRSMKKTTATYPGPGAHSPEIFDHKFRAQVPPAHSMGLMLPNDRDRGTIGPGPAGYNLRRKLPPGPAYSMGIKTRTAKPGDASPGPAVYDVRDKYDKIKPRIPTFKLTGRPIPNPATVGPGPTHKVDYMVGRKAPGYSFGVKHGEWVGSYVLPEDNACINYKEPCN